MKYVGFILKKNTEISKVFAYFYSSVIPSITVYKIHEYVKVQVLF